MKSILFKNGRIIRPNGVSNGDLLVKGKTIANICYDNKITEKADRVIDLKGKYISPGFIDLHCHGGGNFDFMDGQSQDVYNACKTHMSYGTTSIMPTALTTTKEKLLEFIRFFNTIDLQKDGYPNILGLHIEGPYFAYEQKGAQDPRYLRNPEPSEYLEVMRQSKNLKRWSFAVELPKSNDFLKALREHGVVASVAHSNATCNQVIDACENGLSCITHFYSAMSSVHRKNAFRVGGVVEAGYLLDDLFVEAIADGVHLPAELLRLIYKIKGADRICLVTDSMRGAGMPEGEYILGSKEDGMLVVVEDGVAKLSDRTAFAGSVATTDRLLRTMINLTDAPMHECVRMLTLTPATFMNMQNKKGSLMVGKDADIVVFDDDIKVKLVMIMGRIEIEESIS